MGYPIRVFKLFYKTFQKLFEKLKLFKKYKIEGTSFSKDFKGDYPIFKGDYPIFKGDYPRGGLRGASPSVEEFDNSLFSLDHWHLQELVVEVIVGHLMKNVSQCGPSTTVLTLT